MKYVHIFIAILVFVLSINTFANNSGVGNDRDEYGCIASAGYTWSETNQKCERVWEKKTYTSSEDFLQAEGNTCKVATDGCNTVQIWNGELGAATLKYCEDIYGENGQEQWSCIDQDLEDERIGFLSENDQSQYTEFQSLLGEKKSKLIEKIVGRIGDKVLKKSKYDALKGAKKLGKLVSLFDGKISTLVHKYPADIAMSKKDTKKYYILTIAKVELQIIQHRWENSVSTHIEKPVDYVEGGMYNLSPEQCTEKGGETTLDGNGIMVCITGK